MPRRAARRASAGNTIRVAPALAADMDGVRAIAASYGNLEEWSVRPDPLDFELAERGLWVARDDAGVAGYAGVVAHGAISHLADLFVARDRRGGGIGRALLDAALPRTGTRITLASSDPRALPLYARAGMRPLAPVLYLEGAPAGGAAAERRDPATVVAADAAASGRERADMLAFLAGAGAYALGGADPRAYAVVRPAPGGAWLGPAWADGDDLVALVAAASAAHGRVRLPLPGPHPAVAALLERGLGILGMDTYMATDAGAVDLERYVPEADLG
jgi:GNAT superfamily N-acetyltransferase